MTHDPCAPRVNTISGTPSARRASGSALSDERLRFLVVQLQDLDVLESVADVSIGVEPPDGGRADEALGIHEKSPAAGCERRQCLGREVGADKCADVDPLCVPRSRDCLCRCPRIADGVLPHDPAIALVMKAVRRRHCGLVPCDREAESLERRKQRRPVARGARSGDARVCTQAGKCSRGVKDAASRPRCGICDHVEREVPESCDVRHACAAAVRGDNAATMLARPNDTRKLGTVAPTPQSGGFNSETRSIHHEGPVGYSHW